MSVNGEGATGPQSGFGRTPAALPQCDFLLGICCLGPQLHVWLLLLVAHCWKGPFSQGSSARGKVGAAQSPSPASPHGSFLLTFPGREERLISWWDSIFLKREWLPGAQGGWVRPGIQASCRGWAVAAGRGLHGAGAWHGGVPGALVCPLATARHFLENNTKMQGMCLLRVGDRGGWLVHAEPWTLVLLLACPLHSQVPVETWVMCGVFT